MKRTRDLSLFGGVCGLCVLFWAACGGSGADEAATNEGGGAMGGGTSSTGGAGGGGGAAASGSGAGGAAAKGGSAGGTTGGSAGTTGGSAGAAGKGGAAGASGASGSSGSSAGNGGTSGAGGAAGTAGNGGAGGAMCTAPKVDCGTGCVDTASDAKHCGKCGNPCDAGSLCCSSTCVSTASCSFAVTGVSPASGWQNGGDYLTIKGAGFAAGTKVFLDDGRAPAWVKDATTIVVQTPPHVVGPVDVKVVSPAATAVLKKGFTYSAGTVELPWQTKPMKAVRGENPGLAVLQSGKVLVVGGTTKPDEPALALQTGEVFDRATSSVTPVTNPMSTPRWQNAGVTMLTGKVLVVGGACGNQLTGCTGNPTLVDLYDPVANAFTPTKTPLAVGRVYIRSVLMSDGRVFIASSNTGTVDLYDPLTDSFKTIAHTKKHVFGFVVRLRDGRVMLGGGDEAIVPGSGTDVEIFDPDTETFTATGGLNIARSMLTAHTLPDGRVIVIGGSDKTAGGVKDPQPSMETWDPVKGTWTKTPMSLSVGRTWHASALIRDGSVLVLGGYTMIGSCVPVDTAEQVDPVANTVKGFGLLPNPNTEWNAVTMLDGSVLAVGGGACGTSSALPDLDFLPGKLLAARAHGHAPDAHAARRGASPGPRSTPHARATSSRYVFQRSTASSIARTTPGYADGGTWSSRMRHADCR